MFRNQGTKGGNVSIGFAAGERLRLSYLLICTYNPYDLLSCTVRVSRWKGIFYLRFLEMVCLVVRCLETQSTHSHFSGSDELTFSHSKRIFFFKIALTQIFVVGKFFLSKYISFHDVSDIIHLHATSWHKHHDVWWLTWQKYNQRLTLDLKPVCLARRTKSTNKCRTSELLFNLRVFSEEWKMNSPLTLHRGKLSSLSWHPPPGQLQPNSLC